MSAPRILRRFCAEQNKGRAIVLGIGPALLLTLWQNLIMPNMLYRSAMVRPALGRALHAKSGLLAALLASPSPSL